MLRIFDSGRISGGITQDPSEQIRILKDQLDQAEAVLIGAGAGLSTAAGFTYAGERFHKLILSQPMRLYNSLYETSFFG